MIYNEQLNELTNYFRMNEKKVDDLKVGVEFEYFVVNKTRFDAVSYYGEDGVADTLKKLEKTGYEGIYEGIYLIGLKKNGSTITLEPGCQIEISIKPYLNINDIEIEYMDILNDLNQVLFSKNQCLIAVGYSPVTPISHINLIPKKRYDIMENHFKTCGKYAHHMMKGTASLQLSLDYQSEIDYVKKYKVANTLSPIFYAMFDNSPRFEGTWYDQSCIRTLIWNNCDQSRCGIIPSVFQDNYGYQHYAEYILNNSPIFINELTVDVPFRDLFNPWDYSRKDLEHVLSMFFPDVRTKNFIEIRVFDSLPYPFNFSVVALLKSLFYQDQNLNILYDFSKTFSLDDIIKAKMDIIKRGIHANIKDYPMLDLMKWLYNLAMNGLPSIEQSYLKPLAYLIDNKIAPKNLVQQKNNLEEAFKWHIMDNNYRGDIFGYKKRIY